MATIKKRILKDGKTVRWQAWSRVYLSEDDRQEFGPQQAESAMHRVMATKSTSDVGSTNWRVGRSRGRNRPRPPALGARQGLLPRHRSLAQDTAPCRRQ